MPNPTTQSKMRGLVLSATELRSINPEWTEAQIEDYLNIFDNLELLAKTIDIKIDQKIEEVPTDFSNGTIPVANGGFLTEVSELVWNISGKILEVGGVVQSAGRIKGTVVVTASMSPYTILKGDEVVKGNTDTGAITVLLPSGSSATTTYKIINTGTSGNNLTITPNGSEKLYGVNGSEILFDIENIDIDYDPITGWN